VPWSPSGYDARGELLLTTGPDVDRRATGEFPVLRVVDARSGAVVRRFDDYVRAWWSPDPGRLLVWDQGGRGSVVDARSGRRLVVLEGGFGVPADGVSAPVGSHRIIGWSLDTAITGRPVWVQWDLRDGEELGSGTFLRRQLPQHARIGSVDLGSSLAENGRLAAWSGDGGVQTFRVPAGDTLAEKDGVLAAAMSPTGRVAVSTADGRLAFLDGRTLRPDGPALSGRPGVMRQLAFSRTGDLMAAEGGDGLVRVVDVGSGTQLGEPVRVDSGVRSALRPDGAELLVPVGGALSLWDLRVGRWRAAACELAGRDVTQAEWATYLSGAGDYRRTCGA
jgi:WD40 repeat protein